MNAFDSYMVRGIVVMLFLAMGASAQGVYTASVAPGANDDVAGPCRYELTIVQPEAAVRSVLVIFDRGPELQALYNDSDLYRFAGRERVGVLFARHCRAKDGGDINTDPRMGLGRLLFAALEQLAHDSRHGELQSTKVVVLGFAAAAVLAERWPAFAPDRTLGVIAYAPEAADVALPSSAATVPQLVIANSEDAEADPMRALAYFRSYFDRGAPWIFAMQNGAPHRGALANTKPLVFAWLEAVLNPTPQTAVVSLLSPAQRSGWWLYLRDEKTAKDPRVTKSGDKVPDGHFGAGWAATRKLANEWMDFEKKPKHQVDAKYQ